MLLVGMMVVIHLRNTWPRAHRGIISIFYDLLVASSQESSDYKFKAWNVDLQDDLTVEEWVSACKKKPKHRRKHVLNYYNSIG